MISKVRLLSGRLYVVYENSVYASQNGQSFQKVSKTFKKDEILIDTNGLHVLLKKADKYCFDSLGKQSGKNKADSDERNCIKADGLAYYHPSSQGFWLENTTAGKLVHLGQSTLEKVIGSKVYQVVHYAGITDNFAVGEHKATDLYFLEGETIVLGDPIDKACTADSNILFNSDSGANYWGLTCYKDGKTAGSLEFVAKEIFKGKVKKSVSVNTINLHGAIANVWICNSEGSTHPLLVCYADGEYTQYNEKSKKQWSRVPELEDAIDVLAADIDSADESQDIAVYDSFGANFVGAFVYRFVTDARNLADYVTSLVPRLLSFNFQDLVNKVIGKEATSLGDVNYYNKYGLRKNLIFVTKSNKLVCVNSMEGKTLWTITLKPGQSIEKAMLNLENNIDLIYSENSQKKRTIVSSVDGSFASEDIPIDSKATVFLEGANGSEPLEVGFSGNYIKNSAEDFAFYRVVKSKGVFGYRRTKEGTYEEVWNVLLEKGQDIVDYSYHMKGTNDYLLKASTGYLSAMPNDEELLFKVVDSGNVALIIRQTVNGDQTMQLTIVNTVRGKILSTFTNSQVDFSQPIGFLYDDNGIYISYMNTKLLTYELWSIELLMTRVESSFIEMIQTYILNIKHRDPIDYNADKSEIVVLDRKYGLSYGLKYLGAVHTRHGLTKRNLIGITTSNDVSAQ